ncbi:hypothetical protein GDO78_021505 [Eleutherodactylus coqui]|uniref:Uncharacterized protein n=1 Tax=Eleutherodactylus coqui TaxID=57060 RepID=A0A8J6BNB0_ELECQ|nr:hypothetical protein GDO78_021505 [Eleutherodactylus coqui]
MRGVLKWQGCLFGHSGHLCVHLGDLFVDAHIFLREAESFFVLAGQVEMSVRASPFMHDYFFQSIIDWEHDAIPWPEPAEHVVLYGPWLDHIL